MNNVPNRQQTFELLKKYNKSDSLINHALAVEAVMIHFAKLYNEDDPEKWGNIGLIHDLDYEMYPEEHCKKTYEILKDNDWPEEYIHAVMSHGYGVCTDEEPVNIMEKVLFTTDELTGLITATVLMRPGRCIHDLEVRSVMKKFKQKSFAAGVDRDIIIKGADMLGTDIETVILETIKGMKSVAADLGLNGD